MIYHEIYKWLRVAVIKVGWIPVVVFVFHHVVARVFDAYNAIPLLDVPMHFLGGVAIGIFFWVLFNSDESKKTVGKLTFLGQYLVPMMGVFVAVSLWEFAEWSTDYLGMSQAQLSVDDTMLDMFLGVCGGVVAILYSKQYFGEHESN